MSVPSAMDAAQPAHTTTSDLAFLFAAAVLAVASGPGIAYLAARTLAGGRADGMASCLDASIGGSPRRGGPRRAAVMCRGAATTVETAGPDRCPMFPFAPLPTRTTPTRPASRPVRLLLLFEKEWDGGGFAAQRATGEVQIHAEGFDLFRFPANARVLRFDAERFVDNLCAKYRGRIDAVVSNNEQFGSLLAALVAERLGLPGTDPPAIVRAQHKLLARERQHAALPAASVPAWALPLDLADRRVRDPAAVAAAVARVGAAFPLFVKPVKATFSVLARRVDDAAQLAQHLHFGRFERLLIERLVAPFAQVARGRVALPCPPTRMLLEAPVDAHQINVDGYMYQGRMRLLGVVDEWMYPGRHGGARHFLRFALPAAVPAPAMAGIEVACAQILVALGFRHGFFNAEFFVGADGSLRFIEINPRLASQMVDLHRAVSGHDIYRMLTALARGQDPAAAPRLTPTAGVAASFVFRRFDGAPQPAPPAAALGWLARTFPQARLATYFKRGASLAREVKWLGSHRYAVLNLATTDAPELERAYEEICARFGWPCVRPQA